MTGPGLPRLARVLAAWPAPADVRQALLGDYEEEFALRRAGSVTRAHVWLWTQVVRSALPWAAYRIPRSNVARSFIGPLFGVTAVAGCMLAFNSGPVIHVVRALRAPASFAVAAFLNLAALALGGWVAARTARVRPFLVAGGTASFALALPLVAARMWTGHWPAAPGPFWVLAGLASAELGGVLGRPGRSGESPPPVSASPG